MSYVLCGMSLLALPVLIFYIGGSAYEPTARGVLMKEDGLAGRSNISTVHINESKLKSRSCPTAKKGFVPEWLVCSASNSGSTMRMCANGSRLVFHDPG